MTSSVTAEREAYVQRLREWPAFLDPPLRREGNLLALVIAIGAGALFDLSVRSGVVGVGGALTATFVAAALIGSGRLRNPQAIALAAAAPLFGVWLALRTSVWLLPFDVISTAALLALAASLGSGSSLFEVSIPQAGARAIQAVVQALLAPSFLLGPRTDHKKRFAGVVRGALIAIPIVIVLFALLASADALFAHVFRFDAGTLIGHAILIAIGTVGMATLLRLSSIERTAAPVVRGPRIGATEWTVVLGALDLLFAAFAATQLVALSEGGKRVLKTEGLTYAEYARSGFFQLLAVAAITVLVLLALRAVADDHERRRFKLLALTMVALTISVVVTAFVRLVLYERAFGITMLRLYGHTAIVFVGCVLVLVGLSLAGVAKNRKWVPAAAGVLALTMLLAMNVLNPEAFVVRYNVAAHPTVRPDTTYLNELGDDAVAELRRQPALRSDACATGSLGDRHGWAAFNLSHDRASTIRTDLGCKPGQGD